MPSKSIIPAPGLPAALGPYNHGVRCGNLLFCAGQIPLDPATGTLVTGEIQAQTTQVLRNIQRLLENENLTLEHVLKTTVFLTDLSQFAAMNEVYGQFFTQNFPARSTVQVAALPKGAAVEIEVVAHYPN